MFPVTRIGQPPAPDNQHIVFSLDTTKEGVWHIPSETPVAFVYNRRNYAVMLATPTDMVDFALGFSLSERIINGPEDIENLEIRYLDTPHLSKGIELHFKINGERLERLDIRTRRRNLVGTAGCGICGLENADALFAPLEPVVAKPISIKKPALETAMANFAALQKLNQRTKSVHAAAWVNGAGAIQCLREDVGRHNALDKLIGAMTIANIEPKGFLLMSSRCSYEIIDKAARAKLPAILSLSGPTSLALDKAKQANITIYARDKTGSVKRLG